MSAKQAKDRRADTRDVAPPRHSRPIIQIAQRAEPMKRTTNRTQDIDRHVGARIRERRIMLGLTQQQLADLIGVTYQQAHKYERGINRVSAGRLFEVSQVLSVPGSYFLAGLAHATDRAIRPRDRMRL